LHKGFAGKAGIIEGASIVGKKSYAEDEFTTKDTEDHRGTDVKVT
jgi:hypothetical protein